MASKVRILGDHKQPKRPAKAMPGEPGVSIAPNLRAIAGGAIRKATSRKKKPKKVKG